MPALLIDPAVRIGQRSERRRPPARGETGVGPAERGAEPALERETLPSHPFKLIVEPQSKLRMVFGDRLPPLEILPPEALGQSRLESQHPGLVQFLPGPAPLICLLIGERQVETGVQPLFRRSATLPIEDRLSFLQHACRIFGLLLRLASEQSGPGLIVQQVSQIARSFRVRIRVQGCEQLRCFRRAAEVLEEAGQDQVGHPAVWEVADPFRQSSRLPHLLQGGAVVSDPLGQRAAVKGCKVLRPVWRFGGEPYPCKALPGVAETTLIEIELGQPGRLLDLEAQAAVGMIRRDPLLEERLGLAVIFVIQGHPAQPSQDDPLLFGRNGFPQLFQTLPDLLFVHTEVSDLVEPPGNLGPGQAERPGRAGGAIRWQQSYRERRDSQGERQREAAAIAGRLTGDVQTPIPNTDLHFRSGSGVHPEAELGTGPESADRTWLVDGPATAVLNFGDRQARDGAGAGTAGQEEPGESQRREATKTLAGSTATHGEG